MSTDVEIDLLVPAQGSPGVKGDKGDDGDPGANGAPGLGYGGFSATSLAVALGTRVFATQSGLAYQPGTRVRATSASNFSLWMEGICSSYIANTLAIAVSRLNGSGTAADWRFSVIG